MDFNQINETLENIPPSSSPHYPTINFFSQLEHWFSEFEWRPKMLISSSSNLQSKPPHRAASRFTNHSSRHGSTSSNISCRDFSLRNRFVNMAVWRLVTLRTSSRPRLLFAAAYRFVRYVSRHLALLDQNGATAVLNTFVYHQPRNCRRYSSPR